VASDNFGSCRWSWRTRTASQRHPGDNDVADGQRDLLITTEGTEDGVRVGVRDSGPGLSPEKLERIFEPFYTTKPDGHGTFDLSLDRRSAWRTAVGDWAHITGCGLSVYDTCSAGVIDTNLKLVVGPVTVADLRKLIDDG
jgi:hypothetical protein